MKWTIQKGLRSDKLIHPEKGTCLILKRTAKGTQLMAPDKEIIGQIQRNDPSGYAILGETRGECILTTAPQDSFLRLPMVTQAAIVYGDETFRLEQAQSRRFSIRRGGCEIGEMTGMLGRCPTIEIHEPLPAPTAALLYAVASMMLHEDDLEIV